MYEYKDLRHSVGIHSILGLVVVEQSLECANAHLLVLLDIFSRRVRDRRELQRPAKDCDEIHVIAWHEQQELVSEEESAWNSPLVEVESELLQIGERMESLLFAKGEGRTDLQP